MKLKKYKMKIILICNKDFIVMNWDFYITNYFDKKWMVAKESVFHFSSITGHGNIYDFILFFFFFGLFAISGPLLWHMEVPRLGV